MSEQGPGPSKKGYWIGAALVALGVIGAIAWFAVGFVSFADTVDKFERVPANGQSEVTLDTGKYVLYYEGPGADEGDIPAGQASVTSAATEESVSLETYASELSYDDGDHAGQAVLTFEIDQPGTYIVESESDGTGDLAIGPSVAGKLVTTVVGALALGGLGFLAGAAILIVTAVRRRNARPRAPWNPPQSGAPGAPPYQPSPGAPPYQPSPPPPPPPDPSSPPPSGPSAPPPPMPPPPMPPPPMPPPPGPTPPGPTPPGPSTPPRGPSAPPPPPPPSRPPGPPPGPSAPSPPPPGPSAPPPQAPPPPPPGPPPPPH